MSNMPGLSGITPTTATEMVGLPVQREDEGLDITALLPNEE